MARIRKEAKLTPDEEIIKEARKRFDRCQEYFSLANTRYLDDVKFVHGDSDNGYQWPERAKKRRDVDDKIVLTINKARQYCLNITNDSKQNKPSIKIRPTGNTATAEGADVAEGIVRHIEYQSDAQSVYNAANVHQVHGGRGHWVLTTRYTGDDSFDQDLYIEGGLDPLQVYFDPDAKKPDKSDQRFAFIFRDMPKDEFDTTYPDHKDDVGQSSIAPDLTWIDDDHVRICTYYRRTEKKTRLIAMTMPESGEVKMAMADEVPAAILKELLKDPTTRTREVVKHSVEIIKIAGDIIIERGTWVGSTIPLITIVGEESVIEGQYDCRGHVRYLKDPQRQYNYYSSEATEMVALQSKSPYIGPAAAIEGLESYWRTANTENHSILPFNHIDDDGNPIPPPQRQQPPIMAPAYLNGLQIAAEELRMASGQYQSDMGEPGNEQSGRAINARQRQGDMATYHFIDQQAIGIVYTGRCIIEAIPLIYDTQRVIKIIGEDGVESAVTVDPEAAQEYVKQVEKNTEKVKIIFNPGFAKYAVEADIGPAYATRRQEAFNAFVQIMAANPDLMKVAGDLMFRAADFPMAEELAERLKRMVPPAVLGKGPSPEVQQLLQQNQTLTTHIQTLMQQYAEERGKQEHRQHQSETDAFNAATKRVTEEQQKQIDVYKAETDRLKALMVGFDPNQIASMTAQLVLQTMQGQPPRIDPVDAALAQYLTQASASQAPQEAPPTPQ